jgi:hypothetical protein
MTVTLIDTRGRTLDPTAQPPVRGTALATREIVVSRRLEIEAPAVGDD